jgi:hypothetical protein
VKKQDEKENVPRVVGQGGGLLGKDEKGDERNSWQGLPQVKGLKIIDVAGTATKTFGG